MKFLTFPFYQFMFALFCVIGGYHVVYLQVLPENLIIPCSVTLSMSIVIFIVCLVILKDKHRAAFTTAMIAICFFSYGGFHEALKLVAGPGISSEITGSAYLAIVLLLLTPFFKGKRDFEKFTPGLNVASVLLLAFNLTDPVTHCFWVEEKLKSSEKTKEQIFATIQPQQPVTHKPDIYYIVVDAFANPETLKEFYDYDCTPFVNFLKSRGFYVATRATSNYDRTMLSFASFLNLDYLDKIAAGVDKKTQDCQLGYKLSFNSVFVSYLKKTLGYRFINLSSGYDPTNFMTDADENVGCGLGSAFFVGLAQLTLYQPLEKHLHCLRNLYIANRILTFSELDKIARSKGPKLVLAHCEFPHPPFVLDEHGKPLELSPKLMSQEYTKELYTGQLKFTILELEKLVDKLLSHPGPKPVIIIHSDHGPAMAGDKSSQRYVRERMRVFLATRLPDGLQGDMYESMSLVNLNRAVLNKLSNSKLPMLPDRSFVCPDSLPFDFKEVFPADEERKVPEKQQEKSSG